MLNKNDILSRLNLARRMRKESVTRENKEFFSGKIHAFKEVLELEIGEIKKMSRKVEML